MMRFFRHMIFGRGRARYFFPPAVMQRITEAVRVSECTHMGELCFTVEVGLGLAQLYAGVDSRQRALQLFSNLRVWDTEQNTGVLIYLLLADRKVEIVADRGIDARVGKAGWESICREMEARFRAGEFEQGVLQGIASITELLRRHFPAQGRNSNEFPDEPKVI